jgi:hypothetical protein
MNEELIINVEFPKKESVDYCKVILSHWVKLSM